ncbi:MAG: PIN domain-containing protein [Thaumarchaeota archaeon]|nr:PIN domain-containing protein [Nitrososphaerota archaeon]
MVRTVDTTFFLTYFETADQQLKKRAITKMYALRKESAIVPTIVLHEVYKFEFQKFGKESADTLTTSIENSGLKIEPLTPDIAKRAAVLRCKYSSLPTADAIIAATAIEKKSNRVCSDDRHFAQMKEINAEWL